MPITEPCPSTQHSISGHAIEGAAAQIIASHPVSSLLHPQLAHTPQPPCGNSLLRRYQEEVQQQGSFLFPGSFGTGSQGSRLPTFVPKNAANTNIVPWRGGLLAMFESGQPHHLQAQSLQTQGLDLLAGALKAGVPLQTPFSAVDAAVGGAEVEPQTAGHMLGVWLPGMAALHGLCDAAAWILAHRTDGRRVWLRDSLGRELQMAPSQHCASGAKAPAPGVWGCLHCAQASPAATGVCQA